MIKTIYFFGTSHTAGGGFEFGSKLNSFRIDGEDVEENDEPRGDILKRVYSELYPNEIQTQENFSFPGQFKKLLFEKGIDIEVINISKQGYGNERIYRKFYDLIRTDNFKKEESLFIFEFSDVERKELFYKPLDNHIVINYGAVNRTFETNKVDKGKYIDDDKVEIGGYAKSYWYETDSDIEILKEDKTFFEEYVTKTLTAKHQIHILNYNNINFFSFLKLNNFNFLISEMHNCLYDDLKIYYNFIKEHFISFTCYKNKKYNGFLDLVHKNNLLIAGETKFEYADRHPSLLANKIIAKNIFNECVNKNFIKSESIKLTKEDFTFEIYKNKSIF